MSSSLRNKVPSRHFENLMKSWYKAIYAWYYAHAQSPIVFRHKTLLDILYIDNRPPFLPI